MTFTKGKTVIKIFMKPIGLELKSTIFNSPIENPQRQSQTIHSIVVLYEWRPKWSEIVGLNNYFEKVQKAAKCGLIRALTVDFRQAADNVHSQVLH